MPAIQHVQTIFGTPHSDGISAFEIAWISGQPYLFTASEVSGGLSSYAIGSGVSFVDQIGYGVNRGTSGVCDIDFIEINGQWVLAPSGRTDDRLAFHVIDGAGNFDGLKILGASPSLIGNLEHSVSLEVNGKTFLVSSQWGQSGFQAFRVRDDLTLEHKKTWDDHAGVYAGDITAMETAVVDGRSYFFVASGQDAGVTSYWMGQWGNVKERGSFGVEDGLWVSAPSALATATVGGQLFLIVGSAGSDSLSVLRVNKWGGLFLEGHYTDTLDTRFGNVQAMETFSLGNRTFLIAGGGDDGLSLFEIEPGGTLFHIESLADSTTMTLMDIAAIEIEVINGVPNVFVSGSDSGFSHFTIDVGDIADSLTGTDLANTLNGGGSDDLIAGKDGDDTLFGHAGDDRLIDGAGVDILYGGAGADTFVFLDDNRLDTIGDFQDGIDTIYLGDFPMLYGMDQLTLTQKNYGVLITIGNDRIKVIADTGILQVSDLTTEDFDFGI